MKAGLTRWFELFCFDPVSGRTQTHALRHSSSVTDEPISHLLVILSPVGKDIPSTLSKPQFCAVGKLDIGEHAENGEVFGDVWFSAVGGSSHSGLMLSVFLRKSSLDPWGTMLQGAVRWKHQGCDDRACFGWAGQRLICSFLWRSARALLWFASTELMMMFQILLSVKHNILVKLLAIIKMNEDWVFERNRPNVSSYVWFVHNSLFS